MTPRTPGSTRRPRPAATPLGLVAAAALAAAGCRSTERVATPEAPTSLRPGDFVARRAADAGDAPATRDAPAPRDAAPDPELARSPDPRPGPESRPALDPGLASESAAELGSELGSELGPELGPELIAPPSDRIVVLTGPPDVDDAVEPVEPPVVVEAKVGDINGRPIYARAFFAPDADRLIANAQDMSMEEWRRETERLIAVNLRGELRDELLQAETLAKLTIQQRQGLRAWLEQIRSNLISQNRGSAALANRRLQEQAGSSLEQTVSRREQRELVRQTLIEEVVRRINISWRDIQQRYERDADLYDPPPMAHFRLIRLPSAQTEDVRRIDIELASGTPFEELANGPLNRFNPDAGGAYMNSFEEGEYGQRRFFGLEELNRAAWRLQPGQWAGPITSGSSTYWILLESVEKKLIPLYEAQLEIFSKLRMERIDEESARYVDRLIERARVNNEAEIRRKLLDFAIEAYGPKG